MSKILKVSGELLEVNTNMKIKKNLRKSMDIKNKNFVHKVFWLSPHNLQNQNKISRFALFDKSYGKSKKPHGTKL